MPLSIFITGASHPDHDPVLNRLLTKGHNLWVLFSPADHQWRDRWIDKAAGLPGKLTALTVDVTAVGTPELAALGQAIKRLDAIINLADRQGAHAPLECSDDKLLQALMVTHVIAPMRLINSLLPGLRRQRSGLIIHCSAAAASCHRPLSTLYGCSKLAAERLFEGYRQELAPLGINCLILQGPDKSTAAENTPWGDDYRHLNAVRQPIAASSHVAAHRDNLADALVELLEHPGSRRAFRTVLEHPLAPLAESANQLVEDQHARLLHHLDLLHPLELADIST